MKLIKTPLSGLLILEPKKFSDERGFFTESYRKEEFVQAGITSDFIQDNQSRSKEKILRGLHYQLNQDKLIRVSYGAVFDVAVDIRHGSPTFGQWYGAQLDDKNLRMMFIPSGFAHGFYVLSDEADCLYKCSDYYNPKNEHGIIWNDPDIGIKWPATEILLSEKDKKNILLKDQLVELLPKFSNS